MSWPNKPNTPAFGSKTGGAFGTPKGLGSFSRITLSYIAPPPDLSGIPQDIIVPFKNLLKKDSITKAKALEEIVAYVQNQKDDVAEPILEAWTQLYPRSSIDNSRRVRELSHTLLFELMRTTRKRMEKRIPIMVGPWLAGTFDKDRPVSRAASDGISALLDTQEKKDKFWIRCHAQIMDYATEAVKETPDTLSDKRINTEEDSMTKYYRVVAGSLSLIIKLATTADMSILEEGLARFLGADAVWSMATASETFVRKAFFQLVQIVLDKKPDLLRPRLSQVGKILVSDSLKTAQVGSATNLVKVLTLLTTTFPEVWGTKTDPLQRLRPFVEKGSQGGSAEYWQHLDELLSALPKKETSEELAKTFLKAMRNGITSRLEPRTHAQKAWGAYIHTVGRFLNSLPSAVGFVDTNLYPLVRQYLHPAPDPSDWACPALIALGPRMWAVVALHPDATVSQTVREEWQRLGDSFISRITNSLPEVSKDYQSSQQAVAAEGERWFTLVGSLLRECDAKQGSSEGISMLQSAMLSTSVQVLRAASGLLSRRNYKPFGAASVIQSAFKRCPSLCVADDVLDLVFPVGDAEQLKLLTGSASLPVLILSLDALSGIDAGRALSVWGALVDTALQADAASSASTVKLLISTSTFAQFAQKRPQLQDFLVSRWLKCAAGEESSWDLCEDTLIHRAMSETSMDSVMAGIVREINSCADPAPSLHALELIEKHQPGMLSQGHDGHVELVTKLLALTEIEDKSIAGRATRLQGLLDDKSSGDRPLISIIQRNLEDAGASTLSVDILLQRAISTINSGAVSLEDVVPGPDVWWAELNPFLAAVPSPSLSLTSSLGGAYFLVKKGQDMSPAQSKRDAAGRSIPARMAMYTSKLLSSGVKTFSLREDLRVELMFLLCLTAELAADQLTLPEENGLWEASSVRQGLADELEELVTTSHQTINRVAANATTWRHGDLSGTTVAERLTALALKHSRDLTPSSLYSAKVLSRLLQALVETHGAPPRLEEWLRKQGFMKAAPETLFAATACLVGLKEALTSSETVKTLSNRLVSDLIGAFPSFEKTLHSVVLLNACLAIYEPGMAPVDQRKQTLALKQMTSWTDTPDEMSPGLAAETCTGICRVLPSVKTIYGPYWSQALDFCIHLWTERVTQDALESRLPYVHSSIKLITVFVMCRTGEVAGEGEASEDLIDAFLERESDIYAGLMALFKVPVEITQPCQIVTSHLCQIIDKMFPEHLGDLSDLYGLVASESRDIQSTAFGHLHRELPKLQEKLSVDMLLENPDITLPAELMALLKSPPTLEEYPEEILNQFPLRIRSYLLAWHLVFDAYSKASFKLRGNYSDTLKTQNCVEPFMTFMFDVLGHSAGNPLVLERDGFTEDSIRSYNIAAADGMDDERSMHWLLICLFFQTLKYIPGLFKAWYLDCRSKQTKNSIRPWLIRYFSPLVISDALTEVEEWARQQEEPADDEKELVVKVSRAVREVTAGYEIDDEVASILIRIPAEFPLETVEVVGVKRVAVPEKKWMSWIMSTQGVIKFGSGAITDGLASFRRNIVGSLKGQEECAICYSIVSSDKKLPDKECGTCHNSFHKICLFKWFENSGRNSCPLCRNPIEYLGLDSKRRTDQRG
ncbi:E3 ubiquitin-protein ligase listerin [Podospora conica]|nr:E3 ubiquitin-protein ligase listerin [Schizothecium conicum]